jgi:CBS domain-containing protein
MASIRKHVTRDVVQLDASAPISAAAKLMADRNIGSVAVTDGGRIVGLVTERDLVRMVLADGRDASTPIRGAMRPGVPHVPANATEGDVAALMRDHSTRHLLVEEGGEIAGVVSMRDIIQLMLDEKQYMIEQLHSYITTA